MFPDLRYAGAIQSADAFKTVVIDGALTQNGMVSFAKAIKPEDAEAVRAYIVAKANEAKKAEAAKGAAPAAKAAPKGPHG
jgi:alcohol dehydrogenase (cytochrome c)/quinohemoprotein ethanol dehydrogenase